MFYTADFMSEELGIAKLPDALFHYTSIETLALILANRTLRFSRLDSVNDTEEAIASDLPGASTLVFASCWTAQERESLAMWRMYTPNFQGVRISLPNNPFAGRHSPIIVERGGAIQRFDGKVEINRKNDGVGIVSYYVTGPNKIHYSDDECFRNAPCLLIEGGHRSVQLHDLGMVKSKHWEFEEEWRYKILATMSEARVAEGDATSNPALDLVRFPVCEKAVFVPLDADCLQRMDVVLGPCISDGQALIVKTLLAAYAGSGVLSRSQIKMRLLK
jgi:hypothetical protein